MEKLKYSEVENLFEISNNIYSPVFLALYVILLLKINRG